MLHSLQFCILIWQATSNPSIIDNLYKKLLGKPFLLEIDVWSSCSESCGSGYQEKKRACFQNTTYLIENVLYSKCSNVYRGLPTIKQCNNGECINGFLWQTSRWSKCSHSCGNRGIQTRDVGCFTSEGHNVRPDQCYAYQKPENYRKCNNYNCPPYYDLKRLDKCMNSSKCHSGSEILELICVSLLNDGKVINLSQSACTIRKAIPPSYWKKCDRFMDRTSCYINKYKNIKIITDNRVIYQMNIVKYLDLQIGQISHAIFNTKIFINCPVKNFNSIKILWQHNKLRYNFIKKSKTRIKVNKKGVLIIKSFQKVDEGEWFCIAGNVKAKIVLKSRRLSDSYKDWILRTSYNNYGLSSVYSKISVLIRQRIHWVAESWSRCSVSCDGIGFKTRSVRCEKLSDNIYYRLKDQICSSTLEPKPLTYKQCSRPFLCPKWSVKNLNSFKCTSHCIDIEKASLSFDLKCIYKDRPVELEKCSNINRPMYTCFNIKCYVKWKKSPWSECSRSCGKSGIQARYLICVWKETDIPAGNLCYKENLKIPKIIKSCYPPKCHLKCIDLLPFCEMKKHFCLKEVYYYRCCETCRKYFKKFDYV